MPSVKLRRVRRFLRARGWAVAHQVGSHEQWLHPELPGRVTVAGTNNSDVHPRVLGWILEQAGATKAEFDDFDE